MNPNNKKRVVVAMSGGVDSSVAACLLQEAGYDVIGISLKVWDEKISNKRGKTCCSFLDIQDARSVCAQLGIPFYAFDFQNEFKSNVIEPFVAEYYSGRTPNPCILCNQHIKFSSLLVEAQKLNADYLATGHHARVRKDDRGQYHLLKGMDASKDQSYVLYHLSQKELSQILFPIGELTKKEVRQLAIKYQLSTADKEESQDICFISDGDHSRFIKENYPKQMKEGFFVNQAGKILGEHQGIHKYTVGQRRGIGIGFGTRTYVIKINAPTNEVVLGLQEDLLASGLVASQVKWVNGQKSMINNNTFSCGVKIRYQKNEIPSLVKVGFTNDQALVHFKDKSPAISPGQAAVFYDGDEVLGGGWIEKAL